MPIKFLLFWGGGGVGGQTRVDLATLAFFPCFVGLFFARKRRKSL